MKENTKQNKKPTSDMVMVVNYIKFDLSFLKTQLFYMDKLQ
jgi:hypothetical protein